MGTVVTAATDVDGGVTAGGVVRYGESGSLINTIHQRDLKARAEETSLTSQHGRDRSGSSSVFNLKCK